MRTEYLQGTSVSIFALQPDWIRQRWIQQHKNNDMIYCVSCSMNYLRETSFMKVLKNTYSFPEPVF